MSRLKFTGPKKKYGLPMPPFWAHRPMAFGPLLITSTCARIAALHISTTLFSVQISGKTLKGVQVRYRDVPDFSVGDVPQVKEKKIERNHHWKKQGWSNYAFYRILHVCSDSGSQPGQHMAQHMQSVWQVTQVGLVLGLLSLIKTRTHNKDQMLWDKIG